MVRVKISGQRVFEQWDKNPESSKPFSLVSSTCDISLMIYCNLDDENCCC